MLTTLYYFAQVILCSGIMMGYYWLVLRDKKFHQYNRFYLLFTAAIAWIIPLIKIQWEPRPTGKLPVYELFYLVAENNTKIDSNLHRNWFQWNWQTLLTGAYIVISIVLCIMLIAGMIRIARILRKHTINAIDNFFLIITNVQGTPFSFFKYIFWNEQIDIQSESGKQILQHEITHVQQKHSIDKLFVQLTLVAGWFNPFFWLIKGELSMIHEYIADKKSVEHGDTASLAAMLRTAAYPRHPFLLSNPFFFSPIKRRIAMLTNQNKPSFSYLRRLVILPLLAIVLVLFAFRTKESRIKEPISLQGLIENVYNELKPASETKLALGLRLMPLKNKYVVVLVPGHGGSDPGAVAVDGTKESELTLQYAQLIKELNDNDKIEFVLSRTSDAYVTVTEAANFVNKQKADMAVSIHVNNADPAISKNERPLIQPNGFEIYLSKDGNFKTESYALANNIATNLKASAIHFNGVKTRKEGLHILKSANCPIVLTEIGFLSNTSDLKNLKDPTYQKTLATAILQGVQDYLYRKENTFSAVRDTTILTGEADKNVAVESKQPKVVQGYKIEEKYQKLNAEKNPIYVIDGEVKDSTSLKNFNIEEIDNISVFRDAKAIELFGEKGKNGVIDLKTKKYMLSRGLPLSVDKNKFEAFKSNNEGEYLQTVSKATAIILDGHRVSKEIATKLDVRDIMSIGFGDFPVDKVMKPNVLILQTKKGIRNSSSMYSAEELRRLDEMDAELKLKNDSTAFAKNFNKNFITINTNNAQSDYPVVNKQIPLTIQTVPKDKLKQEVVDDKLFTTAQVPASFPGGNAAWLKYLERNLNRDLPVMKGGPPGTYKVIVQLTVSAEGNLSNIKALNNPGYGTAAEAVRVIAKGPKWEPAVQNGKKVASIVKQAITFVISEE